MIDKHALTAGSSDNQLGRCRNAGKERALASLNPISIICSHFKASTPSHASDVI